MTACVNKHSKRVAAVISASLVGALSLGVAVPAFAATDAEIVPDKPSTVFENSTFTWNVEPTDGKMVVEAGTQLALKNIETTDGRMIPLKAVVVTYYESDGATLYGTDGKSAPLAAGDYKVKVEYPGFGTYWMDFTVKGLSLSKAYAFQGEDTADKTFTYTGFDFNDTDESDNVHFADKDGNVLSDDDVTVEIKNASGATVMSVKDAGEYTAYLTAKAGSKYEGNATVPFTVSKLDLKGAKITVAPVAANDGSFGVAGASCWFDGMGVYVNGELINNKGFQANVTPTAYDTDQVLAMQVIGGKKLVNGKLVDLVSPNTYGGDTLGYVQMEVSSYKVASSSATEDPNIENDATATVTIVNKLVNNYYYDDAKITGDLTFKPGEAAFDPSKISAALEDGEEDLDIVVTVTDKDGKELASDYDYTIPGVYTVTVEVPADETNFEYAGTKTFKVNVIGKRWTALPKVSATVDGKDVTALTAGIEWDGEAVVPSIVAKVGSTVLTAGDDYTVTYEDADGNAVESMVEPGEYTVTVDFGEAYVLNNGKEDRVKPVAFGITITKAAIESAKADQDLYAYTGEAIYPTFTAYTNDDLTGLSVAIDSAKVKTTYRKVKTGADGKPAYNDVVKWNPVTGEITFDKVLDVESTVLQAEDLTKSGWYVACVSVPNDDVHFQGYEVPSEPFEISSYAHFSDVDSDAWYAQDVYKAAQLGYMTGISGTDLFMPEAEISRAELAKVFANMAGHVDDGLKNPTQFDDVDPVAWYAEPIAWASEAGIVTGYDANTFGPMDKASREQVATMLYRYAKNQGKDVSVSDVDGALSAYKDGDQVSDWARTAMAWAVENGIFGQGTDELWANQNIKRDAVATIAVRFQPEALPEA